jgi:hypothetical protein
MHPTPTSRRAPARPWIVSHLPHARRVDLAPDPATGVELGPLGNGEVA